MKKIKQPIPLFLEWFDEESKRSKVRLPRAVCFSTIGVDGFPNARFVSFKELIEDCFIITGPFNSRKGIEIEKSNKVALTFWWTATEKQIRVQGVATKISEKLADKYFNERSVEAQAVSSICSQGKEMEDWEMLEKKVVERVSEKTKISRPESWGGFSIQPIRMEFMEFKKTRFHKRKLYEIENGEWNFKLIQP